jgi:hypothetical protein
MKKSIIIPFCDTKIKVFPTDKSHEGKPLYRTKLNYYTIEDGVAVLIRKIPQEERPVRKPGGGRPTIGKENKVQASWWLDTEVLEIIRKQPNQAQFIERLVRESLES